MEIYTNLNKIFFPGFHCQKVKPQFGTLLLALSFSSLALRITFTLVVLWGGCQVTQRSTNLHCTSKLHKSSYWAYKSIINIICLFYLVFSGISKAASQLDWIKPKNLKRNKLLKPNVSPACNAYLKWFTNTKSKCGYPGGIAVLCALVVLLLLLQHWSSHCIYTVLGSYRWSSSWLGRLHKAKCNTMLRSM